MSKKKEPQHQEPPFVVQPLPPLEERAATAAKHQSAVDAESAAVAAELRARDDSAAAARQAADFRARRFWPPERPLPTLYARRKPPVPCPNCRRLLLDNLAQAVICLSLATPRAVNGEISKKTFAYLKCKACGHNFKLLAE